MHTLALAAELETPISLEIETLQVEWEPPFSRYHDDDGALNLIFQLSGVPEHSLCIMQTGHALAVSGLCPYSPGALTPPGAEYRRFHCQVSLPQDVQPAAREVSLWRGLLIIRLPR